MSDQEIRAKALELAFLIQGREDQGIIDHAREIGGLINRYLGLAADIERYIRQEPDN